MSKVRAKKHLGQHFLKDQNIAQRIVDQLDCKKNTDVLEIGAGTGVLTKLLMQEDLNLNIIEIDKESVSYLNLHYPKLHGKIIEGDFLKMDLNEYYKKSISIIGNFPYNISSQILFKAFENRDKVKVVVGMFQKEVAERITCVKGRKKGLLTVLLQTFYDVEYCFTVNEYVFNPPPKVKSGVIKMTRNRRRKLDCDEKTFIKIVKAGYNQRRKTLRNALKSFTLDTNSKTKLLLQKRAEELDVSDFIFLTKNVQE